MKINRNNYEIFLVDYLDGKLTPEKEAMLMVFLHENPDIADEVDGLQEFRLTASYETYQNKKALKHKNFEEMGLPSESDYLCIGELEGDLNEEELLQLELFTKQNSSVEKEREIYRKTLLVPENISYPSKFGLKRVALNTRNIIRIVSGVAASIAILVASVHFIGSYDDSGNLAQISNKLGTVQPVGIFKGDDPTFNSNKISNVDFGKVELPKGLGNVTAKRATEKSVSRNERVSYLPKQQAMFEKIAEVRPVKLALPAQKIINEPTSNSSLINKTSGSTKEYTLSDLAEIGLKKVAKAAGVDYEVTNDSKSTNKRKIVIESRLIAFSTTYRKK